MTEKKKDERTLNKKSTRPRPEEMPADPKELAKAMFWEND